MSTLIIFASAVLVGWAILHSSARKNEAAYRAEREATPVEERSEHGLVDNQPSMSAWIIVIIIAFAVGFVCIKAGMFPQ